MKLTAAIAAFLIFIITMNSCENPVETKRKPSVGRILYTSFDSTDQEIYSAETNRQDVLKLTDNGIYDILPLISPDKETILFCSARDQAQELYLMSVTGENQRRLKSRISGLSTGYSWSPDGQTIVFTDGTSNVGTEIYTVSADGSNLKRLTVNGDPDLCPIISPDNNTIAYSSRFPGRVAYDLFLMDADGNNKRCITNFQENSGLQKIQWSPDGSKIAFFIYLFSGGWNLYVIDRDGSNLNKVYDMSAVIDWFKVDFDWSPDSKSIIFCKSVDNVASDSKTDIFKINIDGTGLVNLTENNYRNISPKFSPDGRFILFVSDRDGDKDVYYMTNDGENAYNITNNDVEDDYPEWIISY